MEKLDDLATCCICTEVYTDPKALPCIHTFCMKCLRETGLKSNKGPGDEMPCPICRRMFKIPTEGFQGLSKNFFIERLIQVAKVSDPSSVTKALCSLCLEESKEQEYTAFPTAETYCVDCKHKLCVECCCEHRKFKLTKTHKLVPIIEYESIQNVTADQAPSVCELHEQNILNVYCADCKTVVCAICFIEEHRNHEGSHVKKCVEGFRKQIQNNTEAMNDCVSQAQVKKTELVKVKEEMQRRVESLECDVQKRKEQIKQFADKHARRLLQGLCSERQSRLKEIQMVTDDIDAYLSNLESYNSYCQRIMGEGSDSDICSAVTDLSVRAIELQQQCQPIVERGIQEFQFRFRQSELGELLEEDRGNLIGEFEEVGDMKPKKGSRPEQILFTQQSNEVDILRKESDRIKQELRTNNDKFVEELNIKATVKTFESKAEKAMKELETTKEDKLRYKSDPVFVQTIRTKAAKQTNKTIVGLTILDKELFVVDEQSSEVEVYDSIKISFSRRWNLKELNDPWDIGACNIKKCLYIIDYKGDDQSHEIMRVDPNGKLIKNWSTGDDLGHGLSVTDESNVILAVFFKDKLKEYSPDGLLIREINLSSHAGIQYPWHAIKLTNGHFLVCHGWYNDGLHRVCAVDADGKLMKSFSGNHGSTIGQMNFPFHLSVDGNGFVMVADQQNKRVLLLDSDLKFKREILSKEKHGLRCPRRILLDELNGRLLVADNELSSNNQRILIFNFK